MRSQRLWFIPFLWIVTLVQTAYSQEGKLKTDWLFVYYMPYDNNLSRYGDSIIRMIGDSMRSVNAIATVQADFSDTLGMTRYLITKDSCIKTTINNEYAALTKSYEEYLIWAMNEVKFNKLAIVLMDHGGKLDALCLDEKPSQQFLKVDSLKLVFERVLGKRKIDLLFFQVCSKGSIEPLYECKDVAKYTLCSQVELGVPNSYYHGLFSTFSHADLKNGVEVAETIVSSEAVHMYNSYTLIDNARFDSLYVLFSEFIERLAHQPNLTFVATPLQTYYYGEKYWDILSFLENMDLKKNPELQMKRKLLQEYISNKLIVFHHINPMRNRLKKYSGLSMSAQISNGHSQKYNHLPFYKLLQPIRELGSLK